MKHDEDPALQRQLEHWLERCKDSLQTSSSAYSRCNAVIIDQVLVNQAVICMRRLAPQWYSTRVVPHEALPEWPDGAEDSVEIFERWLAQRDQSLAAARAAFRGTLIVRLDFERFVDRYRGRVFDGDALELHKLAEELISWIASAVDASATGEAGHLPETTMAILDGVSMRSMGGLISPAYWTQFFTELGRVLRGDVGALLLIAVDSPGSFNFGPYMSNQVLS